MRRRVLLLVAMIVSYFVFIASFSTSDDRGIIAKILTFLGLKPQTTSQSYYESPTTLESTPSDSLLSTDPVPPPPFPPDTT